jgi:glycosyltransferase involved in cell wall biosynthesis
VHEDFGIIPVEAQAAGTPVLGLRRGGLLETVVDGETGFLVDTVDPHGFVPLVRRLDELKSDRIAAHTTRFSPDEFAARLAAWIDSAAG